MSRELAGKIAISLFILFTFVIWIWRNTPVWFDRRYWRAVDAHAPASVAGVLREVPNKLNWVAHRQGLSNKWEMYSSVWRNDYAIIVYGVDANGSRVLLPEPLQSPRTWWEREFVDFREPKFHIHLLRWPSELERYARYLLRRYPEHNGTPIRSIEMDLQWRNYVESTYDAVRTGSHFGAPLRTVLLYPPPVLPLATAAMVPATQPASPAPLPSTTQPTTQPTLTPTTIPSTQPAAQLESERGGTVIKNLAKILLRAWDRFFFARFDPASLAMLRVFVGVLWLVLLSYMAFNWERYYGPDGICGYYDPGFWQDPFSGMNWTEGYVNIWVWWWAGMAGGVLFTIGLFTRVMTVLLWFIISSMVLRNLIIVGGEDLVLRMTLWWCMFLPLGHAGSVDAWIRKRRLRGAPDSRPQPRIWALRLLQLNVLCIYLCSLPLKLTTDPAWLNGDAFFFAIVNDTWSRWPWPELFYTKWMSMLGTYSAVLVEGSIAVLVWTRWRLWAVGVLGFFHVMLGLMLNHVGFFSLATGVTLWSFVPGEWTRAQWALLLAYFQRRAADPVPLPINDAPDTSATNAVG